MKHMKKAILLAAVCCLAFSGCGKSEPEPVEENTESTEIIETELPEELPTETEEVVDINDPNRNPLTGEAMDASIAAQRPVTCMIGNTTDAMPQYGVGNADIIVEAPAEGGLMTVYQDYANLPTIMSVRSCRHYYAYLSNEFEAIYVHYGQAIYATEMLKRFDDLNGLDGDLADVTFFRDKSRKSAQRIYQRGKHYCRNQKKRIPDGARFRIHQHVPFCSRRKPDGKRSGSSRGGTGIFRK